MEPNDLLLRNWLLATAFTLALLVILAGMFQWHLAINFGLTALMFGTAFGARHVELRGRGRR